MAEADFNQFVRLRNQLVFAAESLGREDNLSPVLIPTMSKDKGEKVKLAKKVFHIVSKANRKIFVTLLRYSVDNPESS